MLTKQQIKALKSADTIVFAFKRGNGHEIRAIRKAENTNDGFDQTVYIETMGRFSLYSDTQWGYNQTDSEPENCYSHFGSPQYNDYLKTVFSLLREGDEIVLKWSYANNSEFMIGRQVTRDNLVVIIRRDDTDKYHFQMDDSVTNPGSSARLVRF